MFDGKSIANKLVGSEDERAVSPVIGVILMVAITVILAAVIAAFVLDLGQQTGSAPVNAVVGTDVTEDPDGDYGYIEFTLEEDGNAAEFVVRGDDGSDFHDSDQGGEVELSDLDGVGTTHTLYEDGGSENDDLAEDGDLNIVAISEDGEESVIGDVTWNFD
ncbi:type IV pilin [Natronolimnobius sp. AArcel1]|uniref:type IV pilin n=1 Tax=Natronolimnobius sp. AArcel1 TaxID=1679093 RepID=UPI0013EB46A6|nr:type IV pilin N-terminal domain-containing protein [Natronolimnobius sp. AArcel1]NGM71425.1 type IV pilin [Natronolimnobius sp. AArcel1]